MSGVPYIGAKISLISRSEIRYEGVLAEVDPKEATIGLEHGIIWILSVSVLIFNSYDDGHRGS